MVSNRPSLSNCLSLRGSGIVVGLGDSTIVIHCRDSRSTIVMMIVLFTIVIVVDMIFE